MTSFEGERFAFSKAPIRWVIQAHLLRIMRVELFGFARLTAAVTRRVAPVPGRFAHPAIKARLASASALPNVPVWAVRLPAPAIQAAATKQTPFRYRPEQAVRLRHSECIPG